MGLYICRLHPAKIEQGPPPEMSIQEADDILSAFYDGKPIDDSKVLTAIRLMHYACYGDDNFTQTRLKYTSDAVKEVRFLLRMLGTDITITPKKLSQEKLKCYAELSTERWDQLALGSKDELLGHIKALEEELNKTKAK